MAAEDTVLVEVIRPFLRDTFTQGRMDSGTRGSYKGFAALLKATTGDRALQQTTAPCVWLHHRVVDRC